MNSLPIFCIVYRGRVFYGQKVKSFLQKDGETVYMPHLTLHSVWNLSPTVAVGDNPLYETSFVEFIGSDGYKGKEPISWISDRVKMFAKGETLTEILEVENQIVATIDHCNITNYKKPLLWRSDEYNSC